MPRYRHFAALEEPELLAEDFLIFCRDLRQAGLSGYTGSPASGPL